MKKIFINNNNKTEWNIFSYYKKKAIKKRMYFFHPDSQQSLKDQKTF